MLTTVNIFFSVADYLDFVFEAAEYTDTAIIVLLSRNMVIIVLLLIMMMMMMNFLIFNQTQVCN